MNVNIKGNWAALMAIACLWFPPGAGAADARADQRTLTPEKLYQLTNVWTAHFTLSPEQWLAMQPTGSDGRPRFGGQAGQNLIGPEGGRNGLAAARGITFNYAQADLELANIKLNKVEVRYKGNGTFFRSRGSLKCSLKVDLNDHDMDQKLAGETKLNFHSNVSDPSWMLEPLSYRFYRDAGVPASRTSYVKVYLTVRGKYNHQYVGLYSLVEDVDRHFLKANFGTKHGAIFKPVGPSLFRYLGEDWSQYKQKYDPKTDLTKAETQRMIDFCKLVSSATEAEFAQQIGSILDLDEFARFMAATVCLSSLDSILGMNQNFYVVLHPKTNRFMFIPWDLDNSFGKFRMAGSQEEREKLSIMHPWQGENLFIQRMFQVPEFKKLYKARLQEFTQKLFKADRFDKQEQELAKVLRDPIRLESAAKLDRFDQALAGKEVSPVFDGQGRGPGGGGGWMNSPIKPITPFVAARARSLEQQLAGKSEGMEITPRRLGNRE